MGIFSWLRFGRKKEEEEEQEDFEAEAGEQPRTEIPPWSRGYEETQPRRQTPFSQEWQQPQQPQQFQQQQTGANEIILAKLDVINAKLDSLNQRLANLERYAAAEDEKSRSRW